jgi:hypothetical protein
MVHGRFSQNWIVNYNVPTLNSQKLFSDSWYLFRITKSQLLALDSNFHIKVITYMYVLEQTPQKWKCCQ